MTAVTGACALLLGLLGPAVASPQTLEPPGTVIAPVLAPLPTPSEGMAQPSGSVDQAAVVDQVQPLLSAGALGERVSATVIDTETGQRLLSAAEDTAMIPASSLKLLTSVAALELLGPDHTRTTRVLLDPPPDPQADAPAPSASLSAAPPDVTTELPVVPIVLVGDGDPRLVSDADPIDPSATPLVELADDTAAALRAAGHTRVSLTVDASLFGGPAVDPDWERGYVTGSIAAPVSALTVDGGRVDPGRRQRAQDPSIAAGEHFATMLSAREITVTGDVVRETAPAGATEIATLESAPLSALVEHTMSVSDNDAAEILLRLAALGADLPATSDDGVAATLATLTEIGVDVSGLRMQDGSGLARGTVVTSATLAETVAAAVAPDRPHLRPALTGLPVAGATGTLTDRFTLEAARPGRGYVRAKTGTLSGVSSLTGTVQTRDGDLLAFSLLADRIGNPLEARAALDRVTAALARCRCG